jgi:hypothetical protein
VRRREVTTLLGGAAVTWPLAARAQQPALPVIGFMSSRSPEDSAHLLEAFHRGLREGGFIDGENVAISFRWARGDYSLLPTLATDLVSRRVSVISALGGPSSALAAKRATSTIPIVTSLSAPHRPSRELQPTGRQRNRLWSRDRSDRCETPRAVARLGAGGPSLRSPRQSELSCGAAPTAAARRGCRCDQSAALHSQSQHRPRIGRRVRIAKAGGRWCAAGRR